MWSEEFGLDLEDENTPGKKKSDFFFLITKHILNILQNKDFDGISNVTNHLKIKESFRDWQGSYEEMSTHRNLNITLEMAWRSYRVFEIE